MQIDIITIAYTLSSELEHLVTTTCSKTHQVKWHLFLHSRAPAVVSVVERLSARPDVDVYPYGFNRGLSKSWNQGMLRAFSEGADVVVLANDDLVLEENALDRLAEYSYESRDSYFAVACDGFDHRLQRYKFLGYSFIALNPVSLQYVGCFDENFIPAYYEDIDYARRAGLAGAQLGVIRDLDIQHAGSASIERSDTLTKAALNQTIELSRAYYVRKWGGDINHETFKFPFNNPSFGCHISPSQRQAPFGAPYDRIDWVIT